MVLGIPDLQAGEDVKASGDITKKLGLGLPFQGDFQYFIKKSNFFNFV